MAGVKYTSVIAAVISQVRNILGSGVYVAQLWTSIGLANCRYPHMVTGRGADARRSAAAVASTVPCSHASPYNVTYSLQQNSHCPGQHNCSVLFPGRSIIHTYLAVFLMLGTARRFNNELQPKVYFSGGLPLSIADTSVSLAFYVLRDKRAQLGICPWPSDHLSCTSI